jgi:hypothetical protein
MRRHTLYAYVDGYDLESVASALENRLHAFVHSREWVGDVWVVNHVGSREERRRPEDLESWDLGLNFALPDPGFEESRWFADVEVIVQFLSKLHAEFGRDFVLGIADQGSGVAEDLFFIETPDPDLKMLRSIIGVRN